MTFDEFDNGLRTLLSIDRDELASALINFGRLDDDEWNRFRENPWAWFFTQPQKARKVWSIMQARMK